VVIATRPSSRPVPRSIAERMTAARMV
jgi:hypothetical protein